MYEEITFKAEGFLHILYAHVITYSETKAYIQWNMLYLLYD